MGRGKVIWLNGVSSAGKSSLAVELQRRLQEPYFCLAQDTFVGRISPWVTGNYNGMDVATLWYSAVDAMYRTVATYSDMGLNVIVDHIVLAQDDGGEQALFDFCMERLAGYPVTLVKVICPLAALEARERERGDRGIGSAAEQLMLGLYPPDGYDVVVDTGLGGLAECAESIISALV